MSRQKYILLSIPLVILLMTGICKVVVYQTQSHCLMYVPDLSGLNYKDAKQIADDYGLELVVIDTVSTQYELKETILSQIPEPQSLQRENFKIEVTIGKNDE